MRALVVYESMFGNTRDVATAIAAGIGTVMPVELVEVASAPDAIPPDVELLVVGGPTHGHGMSTPSSRGDSANRAGTALVSRGPGIREWLATLRPNAGTLVAAFDTRLKGPGILWGSAAKPAARRLRDIGFAEIEGPMSFLVDGPTGPLFDRVRAGEIDRARAWGAGLAARAGRAVAAR